MPEARASPMLAGAWMVSMIYKGVQIAFGEGFSWNSLNSRGPRSLFHIVRFERTHPTHSTTTPNLLSGRSRCAHASGQPQTRV